MLKENGMLKEGVSMKKYLFILAIGAAALVSCSKESFVEPSSEKTVITIGISDTKTTISDPVEGKRSVYWTNGDKVVANGVTSAALADLPENAKEATFEFEGVLGAPVNFLYPASAYVNETTVNIPASQGKVAVAPMYGYAETLEGVAMHQMMSMLSISLVKGSDADKVTNVILSSPTQALSGDFTINYQSGALSSSAAPADAVKTVSVNQALSSEPVSILVPVPAGTYDLQVKVKDELGHVMTKTVSGKTYVAGQYVNFPTLSFEPSTTEIDIEIASADDWNTFATAANENIPSYKDKVVSISTDLDFTGKDIVTLGAYDGGEGYFDGTLLGNGHSIKNLVSSNYLVGTIGSSGLVKDITFDASCAFTVNYEAGVQSHFGPLTEYVKGRVVNCHNYAPITLGAIEGVVPDKNIYVGGLVGRIREGSVSDCSNHGTITLSSGYVAPKVGETVLRTYAGGICGYMSNTDGEIVNCENCGNIEMSAWSEQAYAGGIVGFTYGKVENCKNSAMLSAVNATRPTGDACKHVGLGGISGIADAGSSFVNCVNESTGALNFQTAVKILYAGGIASIVQGSMAAFENNTSAGNIASTAGARQFLFGGLIGKISANQTFVLEGTPFTGAIVVSGYESTASAYAHLGGLIGIATNETTIQTAQGKGLEQKNNIQVMAEAKTLARLSMGGLVGSAGENGTDASAGVPTKTGKLLTVKGVKVSGDVKVVGSGVVAKYKQCQIGGIVGGAWSGADIEDCVIEGKYYFGDANMASGGNGQMVHIGGVAGRIEGGETLIKNCQSSAKSYNYQYNNNSWDISTHAGCIAQGCILGSFGYLLGNEAHCQIIGCTVDDGAAYGYRGVSGGIVGVADKTTIDNCTFKNSFISRGAPAGGILGAGTDCTISNCTVLPTSKGLKGTSAGSCVANCGGVTGDAVGCTISDCSVFAVLAGDKVLGGIIAVPDAACSISGCKLGGTIGGVEITAGNVSSYVIGNTAITPGTVTYWDGN